MAESMTGRTIVVQLEAFALNELATDQPSSLWAEQWLMHQEKALTNTSLLSLPRQSYEQLWRGFLPEAQELPLDLVSAFHDSYQKTYIERDVRLLADISNLHQFT
ncbi:MAG: hypothetical protein S4CHLAM2_10120 [Chlamydiales bacterium]|nr:hypothetical protein [Chlamydiales bacterium]